MVSGLTFQEVAQRRKRYGFNVVANDRRRNTGLMALVGRLKNPLVLLLLTAASLSLAFGEAVSFGIIVTIVLLSVMLDYVNTARSENAAQMLRDRVRVMVLVIRGGKEYTVPAAELVPGDVVRLRAGSVVPADGEVLEGTDLFTNEAALTGESFPQEKPVRSAVYMGSGVVSGEGLVRITDIGHATKFSNIAQALQSTHRPTEFQREIKDFSFLIVKLTSFLVVLILVINMLLQHDVLQSILFSLALAVGLTPELLPLIITLNLTKGSLKMAKEGVIVKQLSAVQDFGSMDVLCTDKTGTLTEDSIALVKYVDGAGEESEEVLRLGYIVSTFSTSFQNPLDAAVRAFSKIDISRYKKVAEIPFDFERKREAIVARHGRQQLLIVKGAPEEVLALVGTYGVAKKRLTPAGRRSIEATYDRLSRDGFRVLAVAAKEIASSEMYGPETERELHFNGFLAFLDPAKESVGATLDQMREMGIGIKIITGDNAAVTHKIAADIGLPIAATLTGIEIDALSDRQLALRVDATTVFARVAPAQKMRIIQALQSNGRVVGYLGDGINDAPSLRAADVGISVNNAVDVAKDAADLILLRKNLHELVNGVIEGRRTFANTMKYLRMSLSSNFGNMISMAIASLFLPFLPLLATQILLNNLLYDMSQFALPLDRVDKEEIKRPHILSMTEIKRFMLAYGLLSTAFDLMMFWLLLQVFKVDQASFQAGWFLESIITQVLVVYVIRSRKVFFKAARPSWWLMANTAVVVTVAIGFVLLPVRHIFGFGALSLHQIFALGVVVILYLVAAELLKRTFYGQRRLSVRPGL